jgi:hypothetical protein
MRAHCRTALAVAMLATPSWLGAEPITAANWQRHPAIIEIRAIYREIRQAETAGGLRKLRREFEYCQPYEDTERALYVDQDGAVRSYHFAGGSEDSAAQWANYYDRDGALRFVFVKAGAANGTQLEYRIYLSRVGERWWEERRDLKGPGWSFPSKLPNEWLVRDPRRTFEAKSPCPEAK